MRKSRFTYKGAYHHITSRGYEGRYIFGSEQYKNYLLNLFKEYRERYKVKLYGYCIMDNHYHLVLENSSGRLADFMKGVNGKFAIYFRKREGGRGYVFQDRYHSTLISNNKYLIMALVYVLLNPVRAGLTEDPYLYPYRSINEYFRTDKGRITEKGLVEDLIGTENGLRNMLSEWSGMELPLTKTPLGFVLGEEGFYSKALRLFDRRKEEKGNGVLRDEDREFKTPNEIIREYEEEKGIRLERVDFNTHAGKKIRGEILVLLKDKAGLTYKEIKKIPIFSDLTVNSLGKLYQYYRVRAGKGYENT